MTEREWRASEDPREMLQGLGHPLSKRKSRLLICACCRRVWDLLTDERSRKAVEVAERRAEARASDADLTAARRGADAAYQISRKQHGPDLYRLSGAAHLALQAVSISARFDPRENEFLRGAKERKDKTERKARAALLRELLGNPFRPASFDSHWRTSTVVALARGIVEESAFDRLPIVADALEDAGCSDKPLLTQLRGRGPHILGCWALDLVLGKD